MYYFSSMQVSEYPSRQNETRYYSPGTHRYPRSGLHEHLTRVRQGDVGEARTGPCSQPTRKVPVSGDGQLMPAVMSEFAGRAPVLHEST